MLGSRGGVIACAALAACGGHAGVPVYDEAGFCDVVVGALCGCGCEGACAEGADVECRDRFFGPVKDGLADVASGHADECAGGYERASAECGELTEIEALACRDMLSGRLPSGSACGDPRVCDDDSVCIDGSCIDLGGIREPCVPFSCDRGLYCNELSGDCRDLRNYNDACDPGSTEPQCEPHLRCVDNRCVNPLPESAPCTSDVQCESLSCEGSRCAPRTPSSICDS